MLLFCDVDANGRIIGFIAGKYIIPDRQYHHFFYLTEDIVDDLHNYSVIDGNLTKAGNTQSQ